MPKGRMIRALHDLKGKGGCYVRKLPGGSFSRLVGYFPLFSNSFAPALPQR